MKKVFRILAVTLILCLSIGNVTAASTQANNNKPVSIATKPKRHKRYIIIEILKKTYIP